MGNVLSDDKKQQVLALGRLGWPLRRIEAETGVRRETSSRYLRAAGIGVRARAKMGPRKTGQRGDHRLRVDRRRERGRGGKCGQRGDHRLCGRAVAVVEALAGGELVRAVPRADRRRAVGAAATRSAIYQDLVSAARLRGAVREREALRAQAARLAAARGASP